MPRIQKAERVLALDSLGLPAQTFHAAAFQNSRGHLVARLAVAGARPDGSRWETAQLELSVEALRDVAAALVSLADELHTPHRAAA